ncbi:MAG: accessory factor UbiK family protein [Sulfuricaulis sp.]|nr:accessory factor UbiK family protein [Sulfuricaulis sp.]
MVDKKIIDQVLTSLREWLPQNIGRGTEKNLHAAMQGVFDRLKLVTREELEVQEQVLQRTRARLQELEKRIAELEQKLKK